MIICILIGIIFIGILYLGNYVGVICLVIFVSCWSDVDLFYFLVDYYVLIKCDDFVCIQCLCLEIVVIWLVGGLDVECVIFYWQLDIFEIFELIWLFICVSVKGLFNCVYVYKVVVDCNVEVGEDLDVGVIMGFYSYLVLMVVDILMFNVYKILVGCDQVQYVEMVCDIGQCFNYLFGNGCEFFVLFEVVIEENVVILLGLDGCKMFKSYDNIILLFSLFRQFKDVIVCIVIDLCVLGELKDLDSLYLFFFYLVFVSVEQVVVFCQELFEGLVWGEVKQCLFQLFDNELGEVCECYQVLIVKLDDIEDIFFVGVVKVCCIVILFIVELCEVVGLCFLCELLKSVESGKKKVVKVVCLVSFCDDDGSFCFCLLDVVGEQLLLFCVFVDGKVVGVVSKCLLVGEIVDLWVEGNVFGLWLDGEVVVQSLVFVDVVVCDVVIECICEVLVLQEQVVLVYF